MSPATGATTPEIPTTVIATDSPTAGEETTVGTAVGELTTQMVHTSEDVTTADGAATTPVNVITTEGKSGHLFIRHVPETPWIMLIRIESSSYHAITLRSTLFVEVRKHSRRNFLRYIVDCLEASVSK